MNEIMPVLGDEELWNVEESCTQDKPCPFGIADEPVCGVDAKANDGKCTLCGMQIIAKAQNKADRKWTWELLLTHKVYQRKYEGQLQIMFGFSPAELAALKESIAK